MSLVVITGGARSGKSRAAQRLVARRYDDAVVVVAAHVSDDHEMLRRVSRHKAARPPGFRTIEVHEGRGWVADVADEECLLVDCLGTLVAQLVAEAFGAEGEPSRADDLVGEEVEAAAEAAVRELVAWLTSRRGDTVVVTNEVGGGVVPAYPDARLFRDVLGAANRTLVEAADAAYLAVAGRLIELQDLPYEATWPGEE